jgi:hypothetical protein
VTLLLTKWLYSSRGKSGFSYLYYKVVLEQMFTEIKHLVSQKLQDKNTVSFDVNIAKIWSSDTWEILLRSYNSQKKLIYLSKECRYIFNRRESTL